MWSYCHYELFFSYAIDALLQLLNNNIVPLKELLARNYQFYELHFLQEGIIAVSPQDVASEIFRMVEVSLQKGSVKLFYKMLKVMEERRDPDTQSLVKQLRDNVPSQHATSVQENIKGACY